jgi:S-adenosyl-L-methionine hydrolase (adenosine-forming)
MTVITLLTDFGLSDGYPGVMKGVIWKIAPNVQIADITHAIQAQDILQGAIALARATAYFPPGTIHVAVVDPGVGTQRRPIGLQLGEHYFIGPDNGLFTLVLERAEAQEDTIKIVHLNKTEYWLPDVSRVFHGRDIFAPTAAHLALGTRLEEMGTPIQDPVRLTIPRPESLQGGGWQGNVIYIDHFGNLSTNLNGSQLEQAKDVIVRIKGMEIVGLVTTFGERPPGSLVALLDSSGSLAISVVNGSAAQYLEVGVGERVEIMIVR